MTELERMMCLILSLGDALLKKQDILSWPSDKKLEFVAKYLLKNGVSARSGMKFIEFPNDTANG